MDGSGAAAPTGTRAMCTGENLEAFNAGVEASFQAWTSVQLCREHVHPPDRVDRAITNMVEDIKDWFQREGEVFPDEIETYLANELHETIKVSIEDGTISEVAQYLHKMWLQCAVGNHESVHKMMASVGLVQEHTSQAVCKQDLQDASDDDDDDAGAGAGASAAAAETAPQLAPANPQLQQLQQQQLQLAQQAQTPLDAVLHEIAAGVFAAGGLANDVTKVQALQAVYAATAELLTREGAPPQAAPKKKAKKHGKNHIETGDDGWSTVR